VNARLHKAAQWAGTLRRRLEGLQKVSQAPLIGPFFTLVAEQIDREYHATAEKYHSAMQEMRQSRESLHRLWDTYHHFVTAGEKALQLKHVVVQAEESLAEVHARITRTLDDLTRFSAVFQGAPPIHQTQSALSSPEALDALMWEWRKWHELMLRRRNLLMEWRELLQTRHQALYPALIRRADVVGATCIGIATDVRFDDLEFDMVIADEAGQIQVMDLLVPLVRARRAVLVGDHLQLPPVVEQEITQKIRDNEPENQELGEWLEKSLFELLIKRQSTPASNKVMLDTQYRMPRQIADFISEQFYGGNYRTGIEIVHTDAFFTGSPMVFVDTMRAERHYEQRSEDAQGYFNPLEARLISDLVLAYQSKGIRSGVIVPYKKQAEVIRRELRRRQPGFSEDELNNRVASVDSFQGKEEDVIIFGFTRSNSAGRIGFLTELRRLNVSLTRARHQLVLVGDSITLLRTLDEPFARLMKSLLDSVKKNSKGYFYADELPRYIQT